MATIDERFQAAVNVIKGLPKNGPYQPSTAMMLKFYGLYKQATEGPCQPKRPSFWDVVGKAKWDAWNDNRHLTKQQAMERYVAGLREIIETMSFTENVQNFVGSISGLDNINLDELEMVAPGMRELAESHPNSPFHSRTNSPQHGVSANSNGGTSVEDDELHEFTPTLMNGHDTNTTHLNGGVPVDGESHDDDNESATSQKQIKPIQQIPVFNTYTTPNIPLFNGSASTADQSDDEYVDPVDINSDLSDAMLHNSELLKQIQATVLRMNADMVSVNQRMSTLEKTVQEIRKAVIIKESKTTSLDRSKSGNGLPKWWPLDNISPLWFAVLILWPFVAKRLSQILISPRRK